MKNFTYLFKKLANTPPVEMGGASRRNCTTNFSRIALVLPLWQSRSDSVSIVSRQSVLAILLMLLTLFVGVGQVWGTDGDNAYVLTFSQLTSSTTNYNSYSAAHSITVASKNWSVVGNQSLGSYLAVGGKELSTATDRTITGSNTIDKVVKEVKVNYGTIVNGDQSSMTVNSAKLDISNNSDFAANHIEETVNINLGLTSSSAASYISFTPSGSPWASGKYYRITINCSTTGSKNCRFPINSIQFIEGSSATLSSIAITTQPNTLAYLIGETFSPEGAVVTATMSNSTTKTVTATWTPNTAFTTTGSKTITASYTESAVNKTTTTTANVFSVTLQVVDEDGNTLSGVGMPNASATGRNITASAKGNNYVFKTWEFVGGNNGLSFGTVTNASTTLSGTPTGNVTIKAVYHKPIAVTWKVSGKAWTPSAKSGVDGTAEVGYGEQVSTLPTEPTTAEFCGQKFMGWTKTEIGSDGLDKTTDATAISELGLFTTAGDSPSITTGTTFHAVFADYAE